MRILKVPEKRKKKGRNMMTRNVRLTSDAHRLLSTLAAAMDTSISETIETVIREKYPHIVQSVEMTQQSATSEEKESNE
jgi:predicted HicB family RNase H-like nuclease